MGDVPGDKSLQLLSHLRKKVGKNGIGRSRKYVKME